MFLDIINAMEKANFWVGVDIESIDRFRKIDAVNDKLFLDKIFTKNELAYCFSKKKPAICLAKKYAGKEAVVKALSGIAGIAKPNLSCNKVEIVEDRVSGQMVKIHQHRPDKLDIKISLSNCEDKTIAFAVVQMINEHEAN